jgi:hypothetical protein
MGRFGFLKYVSSYCGLLFIYKNGVQRKYKVYHSDESMREKRNIKQYTKSYEVMEMPLLKCNCEHFTILSNIESSSPDCPRFHFSLDILQT